MKIPDKVRIGSMDYKIEQTEDVIVLNGQECTGIIEYDKHLIRLNSNIQDKQGIEQTLLHEIVHGIIDDRKIELVPEHMEQIVDDISCGLHQVIRDNPDIFK